ncbi:hypothetical protein Fot_26869 [Forsythia ovata]|uniref:Uncharacterized protein n=1 Tax=Forsythia ovata TaxID=205694 RepID=A0ABD1UD30_9LAMI
MASIDHHLTAHGHIRLKICVARCQRRSRICTWSAVESRKDLRSLRGHGWAQAQISDLCHQMICERDDDQLRPPEMHQMTSHTRGDLRPPEMHQMTSHVRGDLRPSKMHQMTSHARGDLRPSEMHQMTSHAREGLRSPNLRKDPVRVRPICAQIRRCAWVSGNECILGLLDSKTVIYVTHQVEFLPVADLVW